jgi:hypothetical protein
MFCVQITAISRKFTHGIGQTLIGNTQMTVVFVDGNNGCVFAHRGGRVPNADASGRIVEFR